MFGFKNCIASSAKSKRDTFHWYTPIEKNSICYLGKFWSTAVHDPLRTSICCCFNRDVRYFSDIVHFVHITYILYSQYHKTLGLWVSHQCAQTHLERVCCKPFPLRDKLTFEERRCVLPLLNQNHS